jgi:serine protease AprX
MRLNRFLKACFALCLVLGVFPSEIASAVGEEGGSLRTVTVHPKLLAQLEENPTGGVTAIVTTWDRGGLDDVERLGLTGTKLRVLPMIITGALTQAQLDELRRSPAVRSVWPEEKYQTFMEDSTWITKARYVWATSPSSGPLKGFGVTGAGIELAMIDTGFDGLHEDGDNLIEYCDTTNVAAGTADRMDVSCTPWVSSFNTLPAGTCGLTMPGASNTGPGPTVAAPGCSNKARGDSLDQDVSHGSHVGGTMVGTGHASGGKGFAHSTIGMAPDAKLRAYSANVASALLSTQILASYDDMTYKKEQGYSKVIAVNNSWGGGGGANFDASDPQHVAFKRAYDAGIVSVFAAGNSGPEHDTLSAQCIDPYVVCVAASTKPDSVVAFSSKGRPSQPSDTNRDGTIDNDDVQPDNHDRRLGQALEKGLYRPTLTAPGVAINSIKAIGLNIGDPTSATCREDDLIGPDVNANCYVQAMGTSMATPHVTGAIGLIGQAFKQERGRVPRPAEIIDILERSANTTKLPGWEAEEQGAGRLDVHQAVRYAKGEISLRRPNFGFPTPPYVTGMYPGSAGATTDLTGCTGSLSWTARDVDPDPGDVDQPPLSTQRYGQHFITVPPNTERLRITVRWPAHPSANLYARVWRPGVDPDNEGQTPDAGMPPTFTGRPSAYHQSRVFPDQEATGLPIGLPPTYRLVDVRAPEETGNPQEGAGPPPAIPSGEWVLRVYHRAGGQGDLCSTTSSENPKQTEGFDYTLKIEKPRVTYRPSAKIDSPLTGTQTSRFVNVNGRAGYPPHRVGGALKPTGDEETTAPPLGHVGYSWEGITNWEVPGSSQSVAEEPEDDTRPVLYMHGNAEEGCSGQGETDVIGCNGPFLLPKTQLSAAGAAFWRTGIDDEVFDGTSDRSIHDPNWSWCLAAGPGCPAVAQTGIPAGPQTVGGPMTVEWWAQCNLCGGIIGADWFIRVWADGVLKFEQRVSAVPPTLGLAGRVEATVTLPTFTANQRIVVHVDPVFVDSQTVTFIYYDSENPCNVSAPAGSRCDSLVRMPVLTGGGGGGGQTEAVPTTENVRVTDLPANPEANHPYPQNQPLSPALRVAWDAQTPSSLHYEVYRSTDPLFPNGGSRVFSGAGTPCTSPQAPTPGQPPGHDRSGLCYTDRNVNIGTVYYYRVVTVRRATSQTPGAKSANSEIAYGMPTRYDRQVRLKVDRLYGPQYWEYALVPPSPTPPDTTNTGVQWAFLWDTLELVNGTYTGFPGPAFTLVPGPHLVFARSFTQGIGSTKDGKAATLDDDGGGGPGPGCPDDDDDDDCDDDD